MKTEMNRARMRACTGMLCVTALSLVASLPVTAQTSNRQHSDTRPSRSMTMGDEDDLYSDPLPVGYPMAAPGTINLYHFHNYRGNRLMEGSPTDMREHNMKMKEDKSFLRPAGMSMRDAMKATYTDNPFMADPAPVNYPIAAPGSLGLYSYSDYTGNMIVTGSATDKRMDREMMRDKERMGKGDMHFDREMMPDPFPVNYPFAAPGSLDLYSFSDYTMNKLTPGSATDRRAERDRMMDQNTRGTRQPRNK